MDLDEKKQAYSILAHSYERIQFDVDKWNCWALAEVCTLLSSSS